MQRILLLLLLICETCAFGQSYGQIAKDNEKIEPVVHYFKFYDGVQMIQLDYLSAYQNKISSLEREHPRAMHWSSVMGPPPENVYIFRNEAGFRVKQIGKITGRVKLLSVKKSKKVAVTHTHFSSRVGAMFGSSSAASRVYPYYLIGATTHYGNQPKNKLGLIDSLGNIVLEQEYNYIFSDFNGSIILTQKDSIHEIRNNELEVEYSTSEYELALFKSQQEVRFNKPNSRLYGLKDLKGNTIVPDKYQIIWPFNEQGLSQVRGENYLEGFVDSTGKEIIEAKYQNFGQFTEGLISARINDKRGFLNAKGETVIPFVYDHAFWFVEGLTRVSKKIDGVYYFGYIDKQGNEVIPLKYANATDFNDGVAEVRIDFENENSRVRASLTSEEIKKGKKPERQGTWIKIDREGNVVR